MDITPNTKILGVWAHPDDEAYLSTGLAVRAIALGGRVSHRHLTMGEQGTDDPAAWPPERLARRRAHELARAMHVIGATDHEVLGLPDGGCAQVDAADPVRWIAGAIARLAPDLVVTFGPDGITGHPDHRAVSMWTTRAWQECGIGELLYAASPRSNRDEFGPMYAELGFEFSDELYVPDDEIVAWIELEGDDLETKRRCLAAHASQTETLAGAMGEERYLRWIRREAFRRPRPSELCAARRPQEVPA